MISKSDWEPVQIKLNQISMKWEEGRTAARHCAVEQGCQLVLILDEDELHVIRTSSQSRCNKLCGQSEPVYSKKP